MNNDKLQEVINESGYKRNYIASRLNINRTTLYRKLQGYTKWTELELKVLYSLLGIEEDINEFK